MKWEIVSVSSSVILPPRSSSGRVAGKPRGQSLLNQDHLGRRQPIASGFLAEGGEETGRATSPVKHLSGIAIPVPAGVRGALVRGQDAQCLPARNADRRRLQSSLALPG